jgi:hypothetical protein
MHWEMYWSHGITSLHWCMPSDASSTGMVCLKLAVETLTCGFTRGPD